MKKFTKYFGGDYMKYWYIAFVVVLICMAVSVVNDRSVSSYTLYIYNPDGSLQSTETIVPGYYESERQHLPVSKMFVPNKPL